MSERTFSDDDLKQLKEYGKPIYMEYGTHSDRVKMEALLARLEAAEAFINHSFMPIEWEDHPDYQAWLRASGKAG